jgi:hypothetical protein
MGGNPTAGRWPFERSEVRTVGLSVELSRNNFGRKLVPGRNVRFWSMVDKLRTQHAIFRLRRRRLPSNKLIDTSRSAAGHTVRLYPEQQPAESLREFVVFLGVFIVREQR